MSSEKDCLIKDIRENQQVEGVFLVKEVGRAETRNGNPYLNLVLADRSGEMAGRVWEDADRWLPACPAGGIVRVNGLAQSFKGVLQLKIGTVAAVPEGEADLARFVPAAPGNHQAMAAEVLKIAKGVADPYLRELLLAFFRDRKFFAAYKTAPAAKNMHHAYLGGLLEHSLGVARLAAKVADLYPDIDSSLLLAGALLHDVGKVEEFSFAAYPFDYTDSGRLVGHHVLGVELVQARIAGIPGFPRELAVRLKHLILSHHGRPEFGPAVPMMLEAFILNFLDDLDAKVNYLRRLGSQTQASGYQWTDYQRTLERFLYVLGRPESNHGEEGGEPAIDPRQQNLWQP
ncbi:MAG: HD domain-containing protein [Desulfobacteraceae bacterium]|nr:HD domain-containing protein [Desulfobacteraceae bacterium]